MKATLILVGALLAAPVFILAATTAVTVTPQASRITVQQTGIIVAPETRTVSATVSPLTAVTAVVEVPGTQGIPGAGIAGESTGGVDPVHFGEYSSNRQAEILARAQLRASAVFNDVSATKLKAGGWELTGSGLKYPNPPYSGTSLERTALTVENNNIRTQLFSSGLLTSNSRLQFKDMNTGYIYWDSVAAHATASGNSHGASAAQIPVTPSGNITATDVQAALVQAATKADWNASGTIAEVLNKPTFSRGYDGREIELQKSATHIQWRYLGDTAWTDLVLLSAITGAAGSNGTNGSNGANGKTYSCAITGGIRSLLYDKNGSNPSPTMVPFSVELREDGSVVTPATFTWSVPASGSLLSGSSTSATFTPTVNGTFSAGSADNRVDVAVTYAGITCQTTAPVPATKVGADGAAGADNKQQIYTKISATAAGDVLNTQADAADADSFAFRTVRAKGGDIHRSELAVGQTFIHARPSDAATAIKWGLKSSAGVQKTHIRADGCLVIQ